MFAFLVCLLAISFCCNNVRSFDYAINVTNLGPIFHGIGAISGGGATSKLLVNYEKRYRDQILDYLFKPNFGASLQILKVEIGGDDQSSEGVEGSHMHEADDTNYHRGYEWWLMKEAKLRNPKIKLYALPWAFPGWVARHHGNDPYGYPNLTANYIANWIVGAKNEYDLDIECVGIWNEKPADNNYVITLRKILDSVGLDKVKIIASDGKWEILDQLNNDKSGKLLKSIDAIGVHYPGTTSPNEARKFNLPLWSSEDYSTFNNYIGAGCLARILNQNFVNGNFTSTIIWNLIASYYDNMPYARDGLMTANQPWSGNYEVSPPIWIAAHTTQFAEIGWKYTSSGKLKFGGSYVSLVSHSRKHMTIVLETMTRDHSKCIRPYLPYYDVTPQNATFTITGFRNFSKLYAWRSRLRTEYFQKVDPVLVENGQFTMTLNPDEIYTLTTLNTGNKGDYGTPPPLKQFPLPYRDNFEGYSNNAEPYNLVAQIGYFEVVKTTFDPSRVLMQTVVNPPINWCPLPFKSLQRPITVIGNHSWQDITVRVNVMVNDINATKAVFLATRVQDTGCYTYYSSGVFFYLHFDSLTYQLATNIYGVPYLAQGRIDLETYQWYRLKLRVVDRKAYAYVNGRLLVEADLPSFIRNGFVGFGTGNFGLAIFDNLLIERASIFGLSLEEDLL